MKGKEKFTRARVVAIDHSNDEVTISTDTYKFQVGQLVAVGESANLCDWHGPVPPVPDSFSEWIIKIEEKKSGNEYYAVTLTKPGEDVRHSVVCAVRSGIDGFLNRYGWDC